MNYSPNEAWTLNVPVTDATGALAWADVPPTATYFRNGAEAAGAITVTRTATTGVYELAGTMSGAWNIGDQVSALMLVQQGGTVFPLLIDFGRLDVLVETRESTVDAAVGAAYKDFRTVSLGSVYADLSPKPGYELWSDASAPPTKVADWTNVNVYQAQKQGDYVVAGGLPLPGGFVGRVVWRVTAGANVVAEYSVTAASTGGIVGPPTGGVSLPTAGAV